MSYLVIENEGICPMEGFTLLGISTSRIDDSLIGQFGSGAKHSVNVLLRLGVDFRIFLGKEELKFTTEETIVKDQIYNRVYVQKGDESKTPLGYVLEYGEMDWSNLDMALREFISNALDAVNGQNNKVHFGLVNQPTPKEGHTRICIALLPKVREYYNDLKTHFLHFTDNFTKNQTVIPKDKISPCRIYKKGVYVGTLNNNSPSLFDYNLDTLELSESRNLDAWQCKYRIAREIVSGKIDMLKTIVHALIGMDKTIETQMDYSELHGWHSRSVQKNVIIEACKQVVGPNTLITGPAQTPLAVHAQKKGYVVVEIESDGWCRFLGELGVPTPLNSLSDVNDKGHEILTPTDATLATMDKVWGWLNELHMTNGKDKPKVHSYNTIMQSETMLMGYVKAEEVYISLDHAHNSQTMLEELAHYITGSTDNSRDFQDFAFRFGANLAEMVI